MSKLIKWILGLTVIVVCGVAGAWATQTFLLAAEPEEEQSEEQATRVGITRPSRATLENSFTAVGTILALRSIELRPVAAGRVVDVGVTSGQRIEEGDPIFRLDSRAAEAALTDAQATLDESSAEYDRYQALEGEDIAAESRLEEARGAFRRAEATLAAAEAELEDRRLVAPFAGTVGIVDLDPGEYVDPATPITTLDDISSVLAEFSLPERYFERAEVGQEVRVSARSYPDRDFTGEVAVKSPSISPNSRSFQLRVEVPNADRALAPGMFVTAELIFDIYEAATLPDSAIISEGNATYVYVVEDGTARRTDIEVGEAQGGRTEVAAGLGEDAQVVVTGWDTLNDGAPVEVSEEETSEEATE